MVHCPEIKWLQPVSKSCNLCLPEKLLLCNFSDKSRLINKRLDLLSKCRHENKYMLKNYSGIILDVYKIYIMQDIIYIIYNIYILYILYIYVNTIHIQ